MASATFGCTDAGAFGHHSHLTSKETRFDPAKLGTNTAKNWWVFCSVPRCARSRILRQRAGCFPRNRIAKHFPSVPTVRQRASPAPRDTCSASIPISPSLSQMELVRDRTPRLLGIFCARRNHGVPDRGQQLSAHEHRIGNEFLQFRRGLYDLSQSRGKREQRVRGQEHL